MQDQETGMTSEEANSIEEMTFEEAITNLEKAVRKLEGNTLGLEQSLAEYAKATQYIAHCQQQLQSAKRRIEQLKSITKSGVATTEIWEGPDDENQEPRSRKRKPS
jgi:exodeoxyribonuclease VII small subunit